MDAAPFLAAFDAIARLAPGLWAILDKHGAIIRESPTFAALREPGGLFHLEAQTLHAKRTEEDEALRARWPHSPKTIPTA